MRILSRAVALIFAVLLTLFAVSNRTTVTVGLWPLPFVADAPLYLLCLLSLLIGALIGVSAAWVAGRGNRRELRSRRRQVAALERELAATQGHLEEHPAPPRPILPAERQLH